MLQVFGIQILQQGSFELGGENKVKEVHYFPKAIPNAASKGDGRQNRVQLAKSEEVSNFVEEQPEVGGVESLPWVQYRGRGRRLSW